MKQHLKPDELSLSHLVSGSFCLFEQNKYFVKWIYFTHLLSWNLCDISSLFILFQLFSSLCVVPPLLPLHLSTVVCCFCNDFRSDVESHQRSSLRPQKPTEWTSGMNTNFFFLLCLGINILLICLFSLFPSMPLSFSSMLQSLHALLFSQDLFYTG